MKIKHSKYFSLILLLFFVILSCKKNTQLNTQPRIINDSILVDFFKIGKTIIFTEKMKVKKIERNNSSLFIYTAQRINNGKADTLKIFKNGVVVFEDQILLKVDSKTIIDESDKTKLVIDKYSDIRVPNILTVSDFYVNQKKGLLLRNVLSSANIFAIDPKKNNKIHDALLNNSLHFKESPRY